MESMEHLPGVWVLLYGAIFHCPVSMAYHLSNAVLEGFLGTVKDSANSADSACRARGLLATMLC